MRMSVWSSDVCSSDLGVRRAVCRPRLQPVHRAWTETPLAGRYEAAAPGGGERLLAVVPVRSEDAPSRHEPLPPRQHPAAAPRRRLHVSGAALPHPHANARSEEHTSENPVNNAKLVCRLQLEKKKTTKHENMNKNT